MDWPFGTSEHRMTLIHKEMSTVPPANLASDVELPNRDDRSGFRSEVGASMAEYALLIGGVALVVFAAAQIFGVSVREAFLLPMAWL